jgi:predicted nucleic acid-binding Zn ribbon protein
MAKDPTPRRCSVCGSPFQAKRDDARLCSITCRTRAHRARQAAAVDLLRRQTEAITSGADPAILATLARDARRLLGD